MKRIALIEKSCDGSYGVFTPDIETTIIGSGDSVAAAKADFENSLKEMIASYSGEVLPQELQNVEFVFKFDVASLFNYFDWINVTKVAKRIGLNSTLMRQYKVGKTYISEAQAAKIEKGLHELGSELVSISLHCS